MKTVFLASLAAFAIAGGTASAAAPAPLEAAREALARATRSGSWGRS